MLVNTWYPEECKYSHEHQIHDREMGHDEMITHIPEVIEITKKYPEVTGFWIEDDWYGVLFCSPIPAEMDYELSKICRIKDWGNGYYNFTRLSHLDDQLELALYDYEKYGENTYKQGEYKILHDGYESKFYVFDSRLEHLLINECSCNGH